ncbi:hypothetical protein ABH898_001942 [Paenibacillus sp. RC82]|uniref:hypothetical protein n=1 Tax=Paenibacillus sp. RC82 TaxID=3156251 RepID=UPI0038350759
METLRVGFDLTIAVASSDSNPPLRCIPPPHPRFLGEVGKGDEKRLKSVVLLIQVFFWLMA